MVLVREGSCFKKLMNRLINKLMNRLINKLMQQLSIYHKCWRHQNKDQFQQKNNICRDSFSTSLSRIFLSNLQKVRWIPRTKISTRETSKHSSLSIALLREIPSFGPFSFTDKIVSTLSLTAIPSVS